MFNKKLCSLLIAVILLVGLLGSVSVFAVSDEVEEAVNCYFANLPSNNHKISQVDFVDKVKAGEDLFVLDIRQPDVYNNAHIKGAVNLPWGPDTIPANLDKLPAGETLYVYCYSGQTAGQTVALLNFAGFDAKSVNLGWNLGISGVDGYEAATETEVNKLAGATSYKVDPEIKLAITDYYKGLADVKSTMFKNYKVGEETLKMMIDAEQDITLLSIRQRDAFSEGHIAGAINIPWAEGMQEYFGQLPDNKIVVYCYTGQTAGQTVAGLKMLGYDAVSLNGGMGMACNSPKGWTNKGFDVVN